VVDLGTHEETYIMAGVGPLKTPGAAKYMRDKVPGMDVPDEIVERMVAAGEGIEDKQERSAAWRAEGIRICIDLINEMQQIEGVAGVHIMAIEWEEAVRPIVEGAGLPPRSEVVGQPAGVGG
jgi:methylenetetrahydrofolate reductase (NADPH)